MVSYPGNGADLNTSRIFLDGKPVDFPGSSVDGIVNTVSGNDVRIGASNNAASRMSGLLDEVRISNFVRGSAWASYAYENQKKASILLTYDLKHEVAPSLPSDLNLTIVQGQTLSYQIRSNPPASSYSVASESLPTGISLNSATGVISGITNDPLGDFTLGIVAKNAKGSTAANLNLQIQSVVSVPQISIGSVIETMGREVHLEGMLSKSGGLTNQVTVYYGYNDAGTTIADWNYSKSLGSKDQGPFAVRLTGLDSGKT